MQVVTSGCDDYPTKLRMLVAGQAGVGKTRFGATAPNPIFANIRGGMMSIASTSHKYVDIRTSSNLLELSLQLDCTPEERRDRFGFDIDTLVIDTVDEFQRILLAERLANEKRSETTPGDYGWLGQMMHTIFESLDLLPIHVVVLSHLKDVDDGTGNPMIVKPGLAGAFADQIHQYMHLSMVMRSRYWETTPEFIEEMGVSDTIAVPRDNTASSYLQSHQDEHFGWVLDRSGTMPPEFFLNFEDDFSRVLETVMRPRVDSVVVPGSTREIPMNAEDQKLLERKEGGNDTLIAEMAKHKQEKREGWDSKPAEVKTPAAPKEKPAPRAATLPVDESQPTTDVKCSDCTKMVENKDRLDLSMIRYREPLCADCFSSRLSK